MAAIVGPAAELYAQFVPAPIDTAAFSVGVFGSVGRKKLAFSGLSNGDTIAYKAVSADDPSKYEVGIATYVSASQTLTRTNANVIASSNSNNRVNFATIRADGTQGIVLLEGITGLTTVDDNTGGTATGQLADTSTATTATDGTTPGAASLKTDVDARLTAIDKNFAEIMKILNDNGLLILT